LGGVAVLRRLAAIGAADVPSYLRPVKADCKGTFARQRPRHDLIDRKIALRKGRTLKPTVAVGPTPIAAV
jgi:hypothetical protein